MAEEARRIQFVIERDGREAARKWVRETLQTYRDALNSPHSHAVTRHYRARFEQSIREFEAWLAEEDGEPG